MKYSPLYLLNSALLLTAFFGGACATDNPLPTAAQPATASAPEAARTLRSDRPAAVATPLPVMAEVAPSGARVPNLFIVGDSTASSGAPIQGWSTPFPAYFDATRVKVLNRAHGGASARSFRNEFWPAMMKEIQSGDIILVQFGHNDGGTPGQGTRPQRPDLRGLGEDTMDITDTNGSPETVHSFGWYMRNYIADGHSKGAAVIILTPTPTNNWNNGKIGRGLGSYGPWSMQVAEAQHVPMVDMNSIVCDKYDALGQEALAALYSTDRTHSTPAGADFNAAAIVAGLKALPGNPLGKYLSDKGRAVPTAEAKYAVENKP